MLGVNFGTGGAVLFVVVSALAREFEDAGLRRGVSGVWTCLGDANFFMLKNWQVAQVPGLCSQA